MADGGGASRYARMVARKRKSEDPVVLTLPVDRVVDLDDGDASPEDYDWSSAPDARTAERTMVALHWRVMRNVLEAIRDNMGLSRGRTTVTHRLLMESFQAVCLELELMHSDWSPEDRQQHQQKCLRALEALDVEKNPQVSFRDAANVAHVRRLALADAPMRDRAAELLFLLDLTDTATLEDAADALKAVRRTEEGMLGRHSLSPERALARLIVRGGAVKLQPKDRQRREDRELERIRKSVPRGSE